MSDTKKRLRPSPSLIISILALVIAMSAGAYAATIAPKNSVVSKSIKNKNVKAADIAPAAVKGKHLANNSVDASKIADGAVGAGDLAAATKTDLDDATTLGGRTVADLDDATTLGGRTVADLDDAATLGGLTVAQIVAASGGEYYEAKQAAASTDITVTEPNLVTLATLNLPHAGKYLVNARVPVLCSWDESGGDPDVDTGDLDQPHFAAIGTLQISGTIAETQYESCEVENFLPDNSLFLPDDKWQGTTTIEFTRMVTVAGPTTVSVTGSVDSQFNLITTIEKRFEATAVASETHIQAITVQ